MSEAVYVVKRTTMNVMTKQLVDSKADEPFDEKSLVMLRDSMNEIGFITTVLVYRPEPNITMLVTGRHRRRIAMELGIKEIPCILLTFNKPGYHDVSRERIDAWENVAKRDLTAVEVAFKTAELDRIVREELKAKGEENENDCLPKFRQAVLKDGRRKGPQHLRSPSSTTIVAAELGIPRQTVEERKRIASLSKDVLDAAEAAGVTQHTKLHQLARVPADRQLEAIPKLAATPTDLNVIRTVAQKFGAKVGSSESVSKADANDKQTPNELKSEVAPPPPIATPSTLPEIILPDRYWWDNATEEKRRDIAKNVKKFYQEIIIPWRKSRL